MNGDEDKGSWARGKKHGRGVYTFRDGHVFTGEWAMGKHTAGTFRLANGDVYVGKAKDATS